MSDRDWSIVFFMNLICGTVIQMLALANSIKIVKMLRKISVLSHQISLFMKINLQIFIHTLFLLNDRELLINTTIVEVVLKVKYTFKITYFVKRTFSLS